jgi:hypothetical protein
MLSLGKKAVSIPSGMMSRAKRKHRSRTGCCRSTKGSGDPARDDLAWQKGSIDPAATTSFFCQRHRSRERWHRAHAGRMGRPSIGRNAARTDRCSDGGSPGVTVSLQIDSARRVG